MKLDLSYRDLTSLKGIDLSGVTKLHCRFNQLTSLHLLPSSLKELWCSNNRLTSLPDLKDLPSLERLYCCYNQLNTLPDLPALKVLDCTGNQLTSLPPLPNSLKELYCGFNRLTALPDLPASLKTLYCGSNQLTSLPDLPWGLKDWDDEKLDQHNKKRDDLGMEIVETLPDEATWDEVAQAHLIWQYRLGGEKWSKACSSLSF